ncbi:MAG: hypothetical protein ACXWQE_02950 [Bdellovibrionales bacterium]
MQFQAQNPLGNLEHLVTQHSNVEIEPGWSVPANVLSQKPESGYSTATDVRYPWNFINASQAAVACNSINANLMDVPHAQTINLNLEEQVSNWQSGIVGQSCLFGGNMDGFAGGFDGSPGGDGLPAPMGNDLTANPWENEAQDDVGLAGIAARTPVCPFPVARPYSQHSGYAGRRTFNLSNGNILWDWSGNIGEWLVNPALPNLWPYVASDNRDMSGNSIYTQWTQSYLTPFACPWLGPVDPSIPGSANFSEAQGVGGYFGAEAQSAPYNAIYRGGSWYKGPDAGIFHVDMGHTTVFIHPSVGFRCYIELTPPTGPSIFSDGTVEFQTGE